MITKIKLNILFKSSYTLLLLFMVTIFSQPTQSQIVTEQEATTIAGNWINIVIDETGSWGEYQQAELASIEDFNRNNRKLGFFCQVKPKGFIIVSLRKELAPVKAYSCLSDLDPNSDEGGSDFLKTSMERILDTIESSLGSIENVSTSLMSNILEINYNQSWNEIYNYLTGTWIQKEKGNGKDNYQEGDILLEGNNWHQFPPYNDDCPWMNCSTSNGRAVVGCVATAGAQIMHYWDWPPFGMGITWGDSYDWPNMPDVADINSPQAVIDALAELNSEVGIAVGMSYGCDGSGATTSDMVGVYENFYRYSTSCGTQSRIFFSAVDWFERIKNQLNQNRPLQYRIPGHSIVIDGWQEIGSPVVRQYHLNYGWTGTGNDAWFTLDAIPGGDPAAEYLIENIVPVTALGSWIFGPYNTQSFNYRYFDRDAIGYAATFQNGQLLQFLPEVVVTGMSPTDPIIFNGTDFLNLRMYTGGDLSNGIRIYDASIELTNFGSIKFYDD